MNSSLELFEALKNAGYCASERDPLWWPNSGTFDVVVGAILTQQTKWEKVEKSLENLREAGFLTIEAIATMPPKELATYIKPSGFYNTKAKNLQRLASSILASFGDFETFQHEVDRAWLLEQKGVGEETADSILCYACLQEAMVIDSYTQRLVSYYGYTFESYEELQAWVLSGLNEASIEKLYGKKLPLQEVYAKFHGMIVMFCKEKMRGKVLKEGVPGL